MYKRLLTTLFFILIHTVLLADLPILSSWLTINSNQYARIYQGSSSTTQTVWPTAISTPTFGGQKLPAYSDVQRVSYSNSYVYINATGLASYAMGPWFNNAAKSILFQNWPSNQNNIIRFPINPTPATTGAVTTKGGTIALGVNGVSFYNGGDAFSYTNATGLDAMAPSGDGIWNRDAMSTEIVTFDPSLAHQQNTGQYHYHINPIGLRFQIGDHVVFNSSTRTYSEDVGPAKHSPIVGWAFDGYPIYGPYGYSSTLDQTSGIRRMVSGYVVRDGSYGTTNLVTQGRVSLPSWTVTAKNLASSILNSGQYGPNVSSTRPLGYYQEDNDYLGDHGYILGKDFDLNKCNARYCVTPDFPNGTWAYFLTINASGTSVYPYTIGPQYYGAVTGGAVKVINETVTQYAVGGVAYPITLTASNISTGVNLNWASVDGGYYSVQYSKDNINWITLATNVPSAGMVTNYNTSIINGYYRVTLTSLENYDTNESGSVNAVGGSSQTQVLGSTGTAHLINISALTPVGGVSGNPAAGFVVSGLGSKPFLIRGVGPTLQGYSVANPIMDPQLQLYTGSSVIASNTNWSSTLSPTFVSVGAFALNPNSKDSAILSTLSQSSYTSPISSSSNSSGLVLLEVYDTNSAISPNLINLSTKSYVSSANTFTVGFVIGGTGGLQLLLRGIGPTLTQYSVQNALLKPTLTLYQNSNVLMSNSGWSNSANSSEIQTKASQVGAFALPIGSADSAILVNLAPGAYTLSLTSSDGNSGTGLLEIYLVK